MKGVALVAVVLTVFLAVRGDETVPELVEDDEPVPVIEVSRDDVFAVVLLFHQLEGDCHSDINAYYALLILRYMRGSR